MKGTGWTGKLISIGVFAAHQLVVTFGVPVFAYLLGMSVLRFAALLGMHYSMRNLYYILTETPYFPVQIALGLCLGWLLARRFRHQSMLYVWVMPFLLLGYAVLAIPTLSFQPTSVLAPQPSRFSHYFGWGCQPKHHCLDQLMTTMPFYAAASYSLGAWLAFKTMRTGMPQNQKR